MNDFYEQTKKLLEIYTFEELLEISDLTEEDVLVILLEQGFLITPEVQPV